MIDAIEAMYADDGGIGDWLARVTRLVRPFVDLCHMGVIGAVYECQDALTYRPGSTVIHDASYPVTRQYVEYMNDPDPAVLADTVLSRSWWLLSEAAREPRLRGAFDNVRRHGVLDKLTLNAIEPDGAGCAFGSFTSEVSPLAAPQAAALTRLGHHLVAAHRLLRRANRPPAHGDAGAPGNAREEAVLDPGGRLLHATGPAREAAHREQLETAARAMDRARSGAGRSRSAQELADWEPFVGARWTLVDRFERDGRRFILAVDNRPERPGVDLLSPREREVVELALCGYENKAIAYELGIAHSTVRVLMARALAKVGARSRQQLREVMGETAAADGSTSGSRS